MTKSFLNHNFQKQLNELLQEKKLFYSKSEAKFDNLVVVLFSLSFFFYALGGIFWNSGVDIFWNFAFWTLSFSTIIAFFINKKNHPLLLSFLPFIMFILSLVFIEVLLLFFENLTFSKFFLTNFDFLFADAVKEDIAKYFNDEKIASNKNINVAQKIFLNFNVSVLRVIFLVVFLKLNFANIKKKMQDLSKKPLRVFTFFIFLVFFYAILFLPTFSHQPESSFSSSFLDESSSENQKGIINLRVASSSFVLPFLSTVLIAPFWEELIYRYLIFKILSKKRLFLAALLSVFVFAFIHIQANDFKNESFLTVLFSPKILTYFWGGFIAVSIYCNYNLNLFFPIFWHAFHNFRVYDWNLDTTLFG